MLKIEPFYVYSKWLPFGRFAYITLLWWVIIKMRFNPKKQTWEKPVMTKQSKRHETWHVWQQVCLFVLGWVCTLVTIVAFASVDMTPPWWVFVLPVLLPFGLYALCWLIEVILPPYNRAYKHICFEGEAQYHEWNENPDYVPFSFLKHIKNLDWKRLGEERFKSK